MRKKEKGKKGGGKKGGRKVRKCAVTLPSPCVKSFMFSKSRLRVWFLTKILACGPGQESKLLVTRT